ncbi:MAG: outer membrane protein assembly factor BamD [Ginsengibacter sp.]
MKLALVLLIPIFLLTSCKNEYSKVLKSTDYEYKLKKADEYFAKNKFRYAEELYMELFPVFKGTEKFEELYYKYAYCSYNQKNYTDAENLFKGFLGVFPNSPKAEEVAFMQAFSFYKQSPIVELDQTNTVKAIGMMQSFIITYPNSERTKEALEIIASGRKKLENKEFSAAELYFNLGQYRAAGISFSSLINAYPESVKGDYYLLMAIKSYYEYAKLSILDKQKERYEKVISEYFEFIDRYPDSKLLEEVENYNNLSQNNIKIIQNEQVKTPANR